MPVEIFMPLPNGALRDYMSRVQTMVEKTVVILVCQQYLHGKKEIIIHGDIKPESMLYKNLETDATFMLADFGLSKTMNSSRTECGTSVYIAPEVR